jgi:DNA-binding transcriptional LysR family regulator
VNFLEVKYFLEIVNSGSSFTNASQKLFVSQPALTKHINKLNKDLGTRLFETSKKKSVHLTESGLLYYDFFTQCQKEFLVLKNKVHDLECGSYGNVQICLVEGWEPKELLKKIEAFNNEYPHYKIVVTMTSFDDIRRGLQDGRYDLAISLRHRYEGDENLHVRDIYSVPRILLFSARHPVLNELSRPPTIQDFKNYPLYAYNAENDPEGVSVNVQVCKKCGFTPILEHVANMNSLFITMEQGNGFALFMGWIWQKNNSAFKYIELDNKATVSAIWRKENGNKGLKLFLDCLSDDPIKA